MTLVVLAGVVGTGTLGAVGAVALLPARFDPRTVDPPPVAVRPGVTPLTLVTTQLLRPAMPLFHVRVRSDASVDRVRSAVLDTYDGRIWSSSARFLVAGRVLPTTPPDLRGQPAAMTVLLEAWRSPFLPVLGTPTGLTGSDVSGVQAGYDGGTQTLVWSGPTPRGTTYAITGVVPTADDGLQTAAVTALSAVDSAPADVPAALRSVADAELGGSGTPLERLRRLEAFLRSRPYDRTAPAGHSFAALEQVVAAEGVGNDEQDAAAFALLARLAGFPARVAVGYRLPAAGPDGVRHVTSHDAYAWPEIRFAGYGWIPFEPTDPARRPPAPPPVAEAAVVPSPPPPPPPQLVPPGIPPVDAVPGPPSAPAVASLVIGMLSVGIVLTVAAIVVAKMLRRAARRRGPARARLHGAWAEAVDTVSDHAFLSRADRRLVLTPALTPDEIALGAEDAFGAVARPLAELASLVTASVYGDVAVSTADADRAWRVVHGLRRTLGRRHGLRGVARAALDPRSLVRRRTSRRQARQAFRALGVETS
jgi:transglutaminase-like putative cysteine protease